MNVPAAASLQVSLAASTMLGLWSVFAAASSTSDSRNTQWPAYGRDDAQQRFAPLGDIDTRSVRRLGLQWWLDLPNESALVSTPLQVDKHLYFAGKFGVVYAVNASTGCLLWTYDPKSIEVLEKDSRRLTINWGVTRGVAYLAGKVYVGTPDGRLVASE